MGASSDPTPIISLGKPSERKGTLLQLMSLEGIEDV
jgi:hypothetical protein